jgi:SAM-dependent methyltransferase
VTGKRGEPPDALSRAAGTVPGGVGERWKGARWKEVWQARELPRAGQSRLTRLLVADGFDTPFSGFDEANWVDFVERRASDLRLTPGTSVFDVGCGAGAFLYVLYQQGCRVAGIDWSPRLVETARAVMPEGDFEVAEARALAVRPQADAVVSCAVFAYFPSLGYAEAVIERMVAKATRAVAVLDVPDAAKREAALEYRASMGGGPDPYAQRYEGLEHCYYDRRWFADVLRRHGLTRIEVSDQDLANYGNAAFRFNIWGFKPTSRDPC